MASPLAYCVSSVFLLQSVFSRYFFYRSPNLIASITPHHHHLRRLHFHSDSSVALHPPSLSGNLPLARFEEVQHPSLHGGLLHNELNHCTELGVGSHSWCGIPPDICILPVLLPLPGTQPKALFLPLQWLRCIFSCTAWSDFLNFCINLPYCGTFPGLHGSLQDF